MPTIQGFTTKGKTGDEIIEQLSATGADVILPISSESPIRVGKNPIKSQAKDKQGNDLDIEVE